MQYFLLREMQKCLTCYDIQTFDLLKIKRCYSPTYFIWQTNIIQQHSQYQISSFVVTFHQMSASFTANSQRSVFIGSLKKKQTKTATCSLSFQQTKLKNGHFSNAQFINPYIEKNIYISKFHPSTSRYLAFFHPHMSLQCSSFEILVLLCYQLLRSLLHFLSSLLQPLISCLLLCSFCM